MISTAVITKLAMLLQLVYTAASSSCQVLTTWPDEASIPPNPVLILYKGLEGSKAGQGATSRGPARTGAIVRPDILRLKYQSPSLAARPGTTYAQAQDQMYADQALLETVFQRPPIAALAGHDPITLDGTCMEAGIDLNYRYPQDGPIEQTQSGIERYVFWCDITIVPSFRTYS